MAPSVAAKIDFEYWTQTPLTYSDMTACYLWSCDISSGSFTVPKSATYSFTISGTVSERDAALSLKKTASVGTTPSPPVKLEDLFEKSSGREYSLGEHPNTIQTYYG